MVGKPAASGHYPDKAISTKDLAIRRLQERPMSREETLHFIIQMSGELSALARAARLDVLAYFLEMARIEAASTDLDVPPASA